MEELWVHGPKGRTATEKAAHCVTPALCHSGKGDTMDTGRSVVSGLGGWGAG